MGSKTRLSSYCTKRGNNTAHLVTSRKINTRLARPITYGELSERALMPSAHGPIFCRKELREKVGAKVHFFLGLSQRTRPGFFCRKQLREKIGAILYRSKIQRTRTDFHSDIFSTTKIGPCALGISVYKTCT